MQPCQTCIHLLKVPNIVLEKGFLLLKTAFEIVCPNVYTCKSKNAKTKLLQMPLASVAIGELCKGTYRVYLVEKQNKVQYTIMQSLLDQWWKSHSTKSSWALTRNTVKSLLKLVESDAERKSLKYAIAGVTGISNSQVTTMYGLTQSYATTMPDWAVSEYFNQEAEHHRLCLHDYQQTKIQEMRSMDNTKLIDSLHIYLKSYADLLTVFKHMLSYGFTSIIFLR